MPLKKRTDLHRQQWRSSTGSLTEVDRIAQYYEQGDKLVVVFKASSKEFAYSKNRAKIIKTGVSSKNAFDVFNYLKNVADTVGIIGNESQNTLLKSYEAITTIPKECVLSDFLNATLSKNRTNNRQNVIFPFGFNLSQQKPLVGTAFNNNLSVIEGPPGTGNLFVWKLVIFFVTNT